MWTLSKQQKGMTLLELLVTLGVIAIVSVLAFPIVGNIIPTAQERAVVAAQESVNDFVSKWNDSGAYTFNPDTATWTGYVDRKGS